ncbi:tRNA wybutosine-synthesizing protein 2 [Lobosporangium transversale]|uniref:tRNA(Phe) (4-demethylwyosine(37)-C(7)) aminocarboxypropyltransferase n=1 Tax=Lobosporangium transversale TaxID=64571 RepID=A0A1Y2GNB8_9FUNG|nr:S-adenosyl-L-methionine-dependent methyltransferase [Lobosporangium transversale]KAF9899915.1 tRNA wybutosine-synthesizing protein 2 [Lobosporangium transversale]ORZ16126.1 S-adenosyl-L-methionine-dependent methyltransferase [Lobosporangium transversale]|eukprot:XP_021881473.1 S-adenosyl-L-methionine-dependent methyltransferase [Lobosporangium transversale]
MASCGSSSSVVPVLLAPASLTKHLKVFLDSIGGRDKTKLITRYGQILTVKDKGHDDSCNLAQHMAVALTSPPIVTTTASPHRSIVSLWQTMQESSSNLPASLVGLQWPPSLSDPGVQKTIFLTWMESSAFSTPKHLLAQTPLEKLQHNVAEFLTPVLESWSIDSNHLGRDSSSNDGKQQELSLKDLPQLIASIPHKWECYSNFTLLPPTAFLTEPWPIVLERLEALDNEQALKAALEATSQQMSHQTGNNEAVTTTITTTATAMTPTLMSQWESLIQQSLQSSHIARKAIIPVQDVLRRPQIRPLTGDWKLHNRFKCWTEKKDQKLLEHQTVTTSTAISIQNNKRDDNKNGHEHEHDVTVPTLQNFSQSFWAETCQNHVWYCWAPLFTMFSAGNITEKERIAHSKSVFDSRDKIVVDLYAGIGYFSLVYLIHAGAKVVHACEWNPWSVEGLVKGAKKNGISWEIYSSQLNSIEQGQEHEQEHQEQKQDQDQDQEQYAQQRCDPARQLDQSGGSSSSTSRSNNNINGRKKKPRDFGKLVIYPGDNAQWVFCFENQAHHVNLGLIPSAEPGWVLGVRALCPNEGGYLHIHHNIRVGEEEAFKVNLLQSLRSLFAVWKKSASWSIHIRHIENVKSFAPMVFHYVLDVECRPSLISSVNPTRP